MFQNSLGSAHMAVLLVLVLLEVGTLVLLWRDRTRSQLAKVVWTVVVIALPVLGALGFLINWALGRLADRLNRAH
ncbi:MULTISPECIES: PLDc N-terminal domain-containing protein [unclassified Curtobacterium]|uniref:PLDc N-terminal domain-containing protein n=1 Tax=unclassified Curtobacterium TaxID=257496 RepID=UPI0011B4308A|nr:MULTISPECIES: PLDc N-terminal domain-containing protein [unclassified Curtobacterium]WIB13271.1 PLDc N-terminal domain-containing protein [Curtobacterium sp. MCPF17_052]